MAKANWNDGDTVHASELNTVGTELNAATAELGGNLDLANFDPAVIVTAAEIAAIDTDTALPTGAAVAAYITSVGGVGGGGGGDFSSNTSTSVDGEIVLFSATGGKTGKRATQSGYVKTSAGVIGTGPAIEVVGSAASPITDTATTRPTGAGAVYWICAAAITPTNAIDGDLICNLDGGS